VIASTAAEIRVQGEVSGGLYWSLRDAGVSPRLAAEYLHALASRIDVGGDVAPFDRFDLVVAKAAGGGEPRVLFAGLHRFRATTCSCSHGLRLGAPAGSTPMPATAARTG
jgi:hypothetical protein